MERSKKELEQVKDFFVDEFSNFLVRACVDFDGDHAHSDYWYYWFYQARARSARARRARVLRALRLLLADGTPTVGGGKTF